MMIMGYEKIQALALERKPILEKLKYIKTESTRQELIKEAERITKEIEKLFNEKT